MRFGGILICAGGLLGYLFSAGIYQALTCSQPKEMSFEEFYAQETPGDWLVIHDAYVDTHNTVGTRVTKNGQDIGAGESFYPVRANPDDKRPIKLFVTNRLYGADKSDPPGDEREISQQYHDPIRMETVRGVQAVGFNLQSEIPGILRQGTLPAAPNFKILRRDHTPLNLGETVAQIVIPIGLVALGIYLLKRKGKQPPAAPTPATPAAAPAPPTPQ